MKDRQTLAIIPARKGSKRLPGKNMLQLAGKPLIQWTIECAQASGSIDEICVTSDDDMVLALAESMNVTYRIERPASLSDDLARTTDVIEHALEECVHLGAEPSILCLLQPTSPLRTVADIDAAIELHRRSNAASVVSVSELEHPLRWCVSIDESLAIHGVFGDLASAPSVEQPKHYRLNGAVYISNVARFTHSNSLFGKGTVAYVMDRDRSIDIDTATDFLYAQALCARLSEGRPM
jgi:CMP-N-acetylneuraminic acid synthetase